MFIGSEFKEEIKWTWISSSDFIWSQRGSDLPYPMFRDLPMPVVLRVWLLDHQHQRHLGTCEKCKFSGAILDWIIKGEGGSSSLWFNIFLVVLYTPKYDNLCTMLTSLWQEQNTCGDSWLNHVAVWLIALLRHIWRLYMCPVFVHLLREEKTEFAKVYHPSELLRHSTFFLVQGKELTKDYSGSAWAWSWWKKWLNTIPKPYSLCNVGVHRDRTLTEIKYRWRYYVLAYKL